MSDPKSKDDIPHFIEAYNLDMSIVKKPLHEFKSMNDFFIRELKPGARPIAGLRRGRDGGEDRSDPDSFTIFRPYLARFPPRFPPFFARFHRLAEAVPTSQKPEPSSGSSSRRGPHTV